MKWKRPELIVPHAPRWLRFFSLLYSTRDTPGPLLGNSVTCPTDSGEEAPRKWAQLAFSLVGTGWSIYECVMWIPRGLVAPFPSNLFHLGFPLLFLCFFTQLALLTIIGQWSRDFDRQSVAIGEEGLVMFLSDSKTGEIAGYALYSWRILGRVELKGRQLKIFTRRGICIHEDTLPAEAIQPLKPLFTSLERKGIQATITADSTLEQGELIS